LLLELAVFFFQLFNATLFGEYHQVFRCIGFACREGHPFPYRLFSLLLAECLNTISEKRLGVQVCFTHTRCLVLPFLVVDNSIFPPNRLTISPDTIYPSC
jgi:hypothetical protein